MLFNQSKIVKINLFLNLGFFSTAHFINNRLINFNNFIIYLRKKKGILNINKNILLFYKVLIVLQIFMKKNKKLLFIEKAATFSNVFKKLASSTDQSYIINNFWLHGTFSNF